MTPPTPDPQPSPSPSPEAEHVGHRLMRLLTGRQPNPTPYGPRSVARPLTERAARREPGRRGDGGYGPARYTRGATGHLLPPTTPPPRDTSSEQAVANAARRAERRAANVRRVAAKAVARAMRNGVPEHQARRRAHLSILDDPGLRARRGA